MLREEVVEPFRVEPAGTTRRRRTGGWGGALADAIEATRGDGVHEW